MENQNIFRDEKLSSGIAFVARRIAKKSILRVAQTLRKTLEAAKRSNGAEKPRVLHF